MAPEAASTSSSGSNETERQQQELRDTVSLLLSAFASASNHNTPSFLLELWREEHILYLMKAYRGLTASYSVLDSRLNSFVVAGSSSSTFRFSPVICSRV